MTKPPTSFCSPLWIFSLAAAVTAYVAVRRFKQQRHEGSGSDERNIVTITLPTWATTTTVSVGDVADRNEGQSASSSSSFDMQQYTHHKFTSDCEMMSVAISLSDTNVKMNSGGPFGAAIFERHYYCGDDTPAEGDGVDKCLPLMSSYCTLVSIGMNRVVPLNNSTCHGEMVAIQMAQKKMGSFTLNMLPGDITNGNKEMEEKKPNPLPQQRQFELFTSCEPCAMCLGATLWSGVSRIVCAATKDDAQAIGFDEGPVYESSYEHLENCGVQVTRGVMREEAQQVLRRYAESGLIYNR